MMQNAEKLDYAMRAACSAARRWLGATTPNPAVGAAALASDGRLLGVAAHQRAGAAHAEAALLGQLMTQGLLAQVDMLCVTLEPCNHHGRTPPCCDAIIAAGIKQVVVGARDPNPQVAGGGIERLRAAGVTVSVGIEAERCAALLYGFSRRVTSGKPWVTVKRALDETGGMVPPPGQKTFTSLESLRLAHRLRKRADAILTGSGTILADNPCFTVRHVPDYPGKQRMLAILDRRRRVPQSYLDGAAARGFLPKIYDDLAQAIDDLGQHGVNDVLVEAGPQVTAAILAGTNWTQDIVIQKGQPDRIMVQTNPVYPQAANWPLATMLPEEDDVDA